MNIPEEFSGRVVKTRLSGLLSDLGKLSEISNLWPNSYPDVVFENGRSVVVLVFESSLDAVAFKLRYGENYV